MLSRDMSLPERIHFQFGRHFRAILPIRGFTAGFAR